MAARTLWHAPQRQNSSMLSYTRGGTCGRAASRGVMRTNAAALHALQRDSMLLSSHLRACVHAGSH